MKSLVKNFLFVFLGLCVMALPTRGAQPITITFSPAALPGGSKLIQSWTEQGMLFSTPNGVGSNDISDSGYPYNGTTYLDLLANEYPLTIAAVNSSTFSISRIDLAEYSTVFTRPKTVTFVGHLAGGDTVSAIFVTDGIIDGNGPLADFQTFDFPQSFHNLKSVTTNDPGFSLDNVVITIDDPHPAFFTGEAALRNYAYFLAFPSGGSFGYYTYLTDPSYIYHFDLGYEYVFDAADGKSGVYLYDFTSNTFFYTSPTYSFPYLYDFSLNTVLYYYPDPANSGRYNTNGVRYFYRFDTGRIFIK